MSAVVVVDFFHSHCLQYNVCLQKRIKAAAAAIGEGKYRRVYIMLQTNDPIATSSPRDTMLAQLQELIPLNENTRVLERCCLAASLYGFKQAVDELDQSAVLVLTSSRRIAELKAYQDRLFTALYTFEYAAVFDECPSSSAEAPTSAHVEEQVAMFLRQLPALKGDISVLRSSLIPGELGGVSDDLRYCSVMLLMYRGWKK